MSLLFQGLSWNGVYTLSVRLGCSNLYYTLSMTCANEAVKHILHSSAGTGSLALWLLIYGKPYHLPAPLNHGPSRIARVSMSAFRIRLRAYIRPRS